MAAGQPVKVLHTLILTWYGFSCWFDEHAAIGYNQSGLSILHPYGSKCWDFWQYPGGPIFGNKSLFDQFQLAIQSAKGCIHVLGTVVINSSQFLNNETAQRQSYQTTVKIFKHLESADLSFEKKIIAVLGSGVRAVKFHLQ